MINHLNFNSKKKKRKKGISSIFLTDYRKVFSEARKRKYIEFNQEHLAPSCRPNPNNFLNLLFIIYYLYSTFKHLPIKI